MNRMKRKPHQIRNRFLAGVATLTLLAGTAGAQEPGTPTSAETRGSVQQIATSHPGAIKTGPSCNPPPVFSPYCPSPLAPTPFDPSKPPDVPRIDAPPSVELRPESLGARDPGTSAFAGIPNMQGNLLFNSHSVSFGFLRTSGDTDFFGLGSTSLTNANVAENNSPFPADRVYFRYNYFHNGEAVTGLSPLRTEIFNPDGTTTGVFFQQSRTKKYDVNLYTFGVEKTFLDGLMSAELRIPLVSTLASQNTISVADIGAATGNVDDPRLNNPTFNSTTTPQNTLGHADTEFGNMTLILKGLLYQNERSGLLVSAGTGLGIPTGQNTRVTVYDVASTGNSTEISSLRQKDIHITNETWSVAPFVAALWVPNDRFFSQGFLSVEVPLNASSITFSDRQILGQFGAQDNALAGGSLTPPFTVNRYITEQTLLHFDLGAGYWAYREPSNRWLTGIAPNLEVHYTTTLNKARRVQLPGDATATQFNPLNPIGDLIAQRDQIPEIGPVVGGQTNRMNIVDLTVGSTFELGKRTMLATAVTVPLTNNNNKTFDWEFQVQLNYYFGGR